MSTKLKRSNHCDCRTIRIVLQEYSKEILIDIPGKLGEVLLNLRDKEKRRVKKQRYRNNRKITLNQKDSRSEKAAQTCDKSFKNDEGYLSVIGKTLSSFVAI